ncbi:MAG: 3-methyl-2-oxobutanoate hydroxymethyltransferase (plasmid) [Arsenophonus sp.]|nr:MAG: 3-methyl-2-oxobutanoate hydroxymethyltransferase [Arsenophonus sp.]
MKITTISDLKKWKQKKQKFAAITAYDATFAKLFYEQGIHVILVGDSLGMTIQGHNSTLPVTIKDMIYHTSCVRRGAPSCLLLADLPFMSYATEAETFNNSAALMRVGANMIKLEGGDLWVINTVKELTQRSIPVCSHLGLTPQSINIFGGYKIQGRDQISSEKLLNSALSLESAGSQLLVLECVSVDLAKSITNALTIPVIGIGAGNVTDGQILVMQDVLGVTGENTPSFAKNFLTKGANIQDAIRHYVDDVKSSQFPSSEHTFY